MCTREAVVVQESTTGAHERLCWYRRVLQAIGRLSWYYSNTLEAVLLKQSTKGPLGKLCWYRRVLYEHLRGCAGTKEYYSSTREAVLVQRNIGAFVRLCCNSRIL